MRTTSSRRRCSRERDLPASDASYPNGQRNYWKSHMVAAITAGAVDVLMEHGPRITSPLSSFYFQHLGGAIGRAGAETAAFGHRDALFDFTILTVCAIRPRTASTSPGRATSSRRCSRTRPASTSTTSASRAPTASGAAYAPETYERLVALKDVHDPHNVFRLNQNVAPSRAWTGRSGAAAVASRPGSRMAV